MKQVNLTVTFFKATLTHPIITCLLVSTCIVFNKNIFTVESALKATLLKMNKRDLMIFVKFQENPFSEMLIE